MNRKPTLAFVDHSFHKKSHSGDFLRELLSTEFEIHDYWDYSSEGGPTVSPDDINKHEYVFYLQVLSPFQELREIHIPIIWAPMYDSVKFRWLYWKTISLFPIKIISFSQHLTEWCSKFDLDMYTAQYYMPPSDYRAPTGNHFFFWYRGDVSFDDIKGFINPDQVDRFVYRSNPDPTKKALKISEEDIKKYKVEIIESSFMPQEDYVKLLNQATIFIAPRKKEGIGMSFIEALSRGQCVIGWNTPTLNEYITDTVDGYLIDEAGPKKYLDVSPQKLAVIRRNCEERYHQGHEIWDAHKKEIVSFLLEPHRPAAPYYKILLYSYLYEADLFFRRAVYKIKTTLHF